MANEETVIPPASEVEETTEVASTAEPAASAQTASASTGPTGWDALDEWYKAQTSDAEDVDKKLDAHASGFTQDHFATLDPAAQTTVMAVRAQYEKRLAAAEKAAEEKAAADKAAADRRDAAMKAKERQLLQRERALFAAAAAAPDPGKEPEVDVFTVEGAKARQEYLARKAHYEASAPVREQAQKAAIVAEWENIVNDFPELADPKVSAEFDAFMDKQNEGIDVSKGQRPRVTTRVGARLFTNERELAKVRAEREQRVRADDNARAQAATKIGGRAGGSPLGDPVSKFNTLMAKDEDEAWGFFAKLPASDQARIQSTFQ